MNKVNIPERTKALSEGSISCFCGGKKCIGECSWQELVNSGKLFVV
jgi:hypothetical protein